MYLPSLKQIVISGTPWLKVVYHYGKLQFITDFCMMCFYEMRWTVINDSKSFLNILRPATILNWFTPNIHKQNRLQCTQWKRVRLQLNDIKTSETVVWLCVHWLITCSHSHCFLLTCRPPIYKWPKFIGS